MQDTAASTLTYGSNQPRIRMYLITAILAANLPLCIMLLIEPFLRAQALMDQVYAATHNSGLDPRDWAPYAWTGLGNFLYNISFFVLLSQICFITPLAVSQIHTFRISRETQSPGERITHLAFVGATALLLFVVQIIGCGIMTWLED